MSDSPSVRIGEAIRRLEEMQATFNLAVDAQRHYLEARRLTIDINIPPHDPEIDAAFGRQAMWFVDAIIADTPLKNKEIEGGK